jgi:O-antigen ligase
MILFYVACRVRLRKSYLFYAGVMLLILLSQTILESLPRYLSVIFPLHIGLAAATARSEGLYLAALVTSTGLMAVCLVLFASGYWMT